MRMSGEMYSFLFGFFVLIAGNNFDWKKRFDCHPESSVMEFKCIVRGCIWDPCPVNASQNCPSCIYPDDWGYILDEKKEMNNGIQYIMKQGIHYFPFGHDISTLELNVYFETDTRLHLKFNDPNDNDRFEVPIDLPEIPDNKASNPIYSVMESNNSKGIFGLNVFQNNEQIFTTGIPGFAYSKQFHQIMFGFNDNNIKSYGFGERYYNLKFPYDKWEVWPSFSRDIGDWNSPRNSYGVHPFILSILSNNNAFGIFIVNSNAMEIGITPYPGIQYITIGGILDIYVLFGPTPKDVIKQYWELIGFPYFPAYYSLGFHLCRWGYNTLNRTREVVLNMRNNNIPYDTQWNDIDYMHGYKDFTIDDINFKGLSQFVNDELHGKYNMKYVMIIDPGIANETNYYPYITGIENDVFIRDINGDILYGKVWPNITAFPDFFAPQTIKWWTNMSIKWYNKVNFDGYARLIR